MAPLRLCPGTGETRDQPLTTHLSHTTELVDFLVPPQQRYCSHRDRRTLQSAGIERQSNTKIAVTTNMSEIEWTTVGIHREDHRRLDEINQYGESQRETIVRLMEFWEEHDNE